MNSGLSSIDAKDIYGQKLSIESDRHTDITVDSCEYKAVSSHRLPCIVKTINKSDKVEICIHKADEFPDTEDSTGQAVNILEPFKPRDRIELELKLTPKKQDENKDKKNKEVTPATKNKISKEIYLNGELRGFGAKIEYFRSPFMPSIRFIPLNILLTITKSIIILAVTFAIITVIIINRYIIFKPENDLNGNNNTKDTAERIDVNKHYRGSLSNSFEYEEDWFTFNLETPSRLILEFKSQPQSNSAGDYWDIRIRSYDAGNGNPSIDPVIWRRFVSGETGTMTSSAMPFPAGQYYIEIESADFYTRDQYSFVIRSQPNESAWESEPNNSVEKANDIVFNEEKNGRLIASFESEKDWYLIRLEEPRKISLKLRTQRQHNDNANYWDIQFMNETQARLTEEERKKNSSYLWQKFVAGDETDTLFASENELDPGTYYIKIESGDKFSRDYYSIFVED